jgi:hypothetical protein
LLVLGALARPAVASAQGGGDTVRTAGDTARAAADSLRAVIATDPLGGGGRPRTALGTQARAAQESFERNHRMGLRFYNGGALASCEVPIGRICYWNNNGDVPPPAERADARIEREQLLALLARAQAADSADDWVAGMRVRYAIELGRADTAIAAARACAGTAWWCAALEGLALHVDNRHVEAGRAFDRALREMPEAQRCAWTDLSWWLDPAMLPAYAALGCAGRAAENARVLRLAQPLWMLPGNDLANEWYARRTISRVHSMGRIPYDLQWGDDLLESQVRYGWPTAWSVQNGGVADPRPPSVIGHEPTPSYDFMPTPKAIAEPRAASPGDWDPMRAKARMRYAPRYATGFGALPHQFARFRRGDSTLVAGAWRLVRELGMGRAPYRAGFTLDGLAGAAPVQVVRDSASANGALLAAIGRDPMLASLEVLGLPGRKAARARAAVAPLPAEARLSDFLLLQRADASGTPALEALAGQAYGSLELDGRASFGLYWETYRPASPAAPLQVSVRATRVNSSFMQRVTSSIGLSRAVQPVSVRFADNGRPDGGVGRSLAITMPEVPAGDYRLTLVVSGGGVADSTSRIIRVNARP